MGENNNKVAFNASIDLLKEIMGLLKKAVSHYIDSNISDAFLCCKGAKLMSIQHFNETEKNDLQNKEKSISEHLANYRKNLDNDNTNCILDRGRAIKEYEVYHTSLMILLDKYGLLLKEKEDQTEFD